MGSHHPDEHYQILELCNYKLGHSTLADMPWEYAEKCRSAILPFIAWCIANTVAALGAYNPFWVAFLLRLFSGLLAWLVAYRMLRLLLPELNTEIARKKYVQCSMLLWYVPYIGVRFSSENIAGLLFFLAMTLLYRPKGAQSASVLQLFWAGFLLGLALFVRVQIGLAYVGLLAWLLLLAKLPLRSWIVLIVSGVCAAAAALCLDHWLYGQWTVSAINYFNIQLVQNKAAAWGTTAWWDYFWMFFQMAFPPIAIALLVTFFAGVYKRPRHPFTWLMVTFVIGHLLIGHKEMRFMYPMSLAFIYLACAGYDEVITKRLSEKWDRIIFRTLAVVNAVLLTVKMLTPAQEAVCYYKFIYNQCRQQPVCLLARGASPYNTVGAEMRFYRHDRMQLKVFNDVSEVDGMLQKDGGNDLLYLSTRIETNTRLGSYQLRRVYSIYPDWLLKIDLFEWQARSNIWVVYRLTKAN